MTQEWFQTHVTDALERLERKQDAHAKEFRDFRNTDVAALRERVARVEVRAGFVALLIAALVTAVGAWIR